MTLSVLFMPPFFQGPMGWLVLYFVVQRYMFLILGVLFSPVSGNYWNKQMTLGPSTSLRLQDCCVMLWKEPYPPWWMFFLVSLYESYYDATLTSNSYDQIFVLLVLIWKFRIWNCMHSINSKSDRTFILNQLPARLSSLHDVIKVVFEGCQI